MPTRRDRIHELHRVAALPPTPGRHAAAKASALRELLRLGDESALTGAAAVGRGSRPSTQIDARDADVRAGSGSDYPRLRERRLAVAGRQTGKAFVYGARRAADQPDAHRAAAGAHVAQRRRVRCRRRRLLHRLHRACAVAGAAQTRWLPLGAVPRLHRHAGRTRVRRRGDQRQRDRGERSQFTRSGARPGTRAAHARTFWVSEVGASTR